ncbi:MAG: hypothetical protein EXS68_01010 [Candidatus Ryanbacteria bacterium]|nr:hypothetical protein [Candidatus Ryanbacteria bacterium]
MNKFLIGIVVVALIGVGGFIMLTGKEDAQAPTGDEVMKKEDTTVIEKKEEVMVKETVVKITKTGFVPNQVTIKMGEAVRFQNESGDASWPASAMHPTHTMYPGSDIKKCDTTEEPKIFDACRGLADGESWSFVFTEKGAWKYHDHVVSGKFGGITVE